MELLPAVHARARLALKQAAQYHLFDPNVSLIDFGYPEHDGWLHTDELAIRIHVRKKMSGAVLEAAVEEGATRLIPESYGDFPTDVPQSDIHIHQRWWFPRTQTYVNARTRRQNPLRGGISISNQFQRSSGTLGSVVFDRETGAGMVLSNWHVLVGRWAARRGQRILQPGRLDGGTGYDAFANLSRDAMSHNLDAAVAALDSDRRLINDQLELGPITGVTRPQLGMRVVKSGCRTGITYGMVAAIEGLARLRYDSLDRVIRHVLTIEPENGFDQVSGPGDSGSIWLQENNDRAVGLHFAGSDSPERALAMEMQAVLDALNVDLAGTIKSGPSYMVVPQEENLKV